jgi:competence ComEA-like helix-hairpin-helix protein
MRGVWISFALLATAAGAQEPKQVFEKVCGSCHKPETALSARRSREQWQETVDAMAAKGLKGTDEELTVVLDYLVGQYGRVNVNRATAGEISEILGLSAKEAEAIVKYRKDNGRFEDFDMLGKVAGVDLTKLEKNREAISF